MTPEREHQLRQEIAELGERIDRVPLTEAIVHMPDEVNQLRALVAELFEGRRGKPELN